MQQILDPSIVLLLRLLLLSVAVGAVMGIAYALVKWRIKRILGEAGLQVQSGEHEVTEAMRVRVH